MDSQFYELWQHKKYKEGVEIYSKKLVRDDKNIAAREALVLFLFMHGRHNKKRGLLSEAVSMAKSMISEGGGLFGANMVIGYEKTRRGGYEESLENYSKALSVARDDIEKRIALTELAVMLTFIGRGEEAEDIIIELTDIDGITPLVRYIHVNALRQQHRFREAITEYKGLTRAYKPAPFMEYVAALLRYSRPHSSFLEAIIFGALYLLLGISYVFLHLLSGMSAIWLFIFILIVDVTTSKVDKVRIKKLR